MCCLEDTRLWREQQSSEHLRNLYYQRTYGLSLSEFNSMWNSQNGRCPICSKALELGRSSHNSACVDHCHQTGKVRGILCNECNRGLGYFHDNVTTLSKAIRYLSKEDLPLGKEDALAVPT